jgi:hypothetical protein
MAFLAREATSLTSWVLLAKTRSRLWCTTLPRTLRELVELLLIAGFWRMAAGFVKSAKIPLDTGVPS